ncbi:MAG TPA: hypothetical protein VLZ74_00645 [Methylocella sp.]|nr:hypothetical protein [Methylocella sp.]
MTPSLVTADVALSLCACITVYAVICAFGLFYICRLLRDGPAEPQGRDNITRSRPMAVATEATSGGED